MLPAALRLPARLPACCLLFRIHIKSQLQAELSYLYFNVSVCVCVCVCMSAALGNNFKIQNHARKQTQCGRHMSPASSSCSLPLYPDAIDVDVDVDVDVSMHACVCATLTNGRIWTWLLRIFRQFFPPKFVNRKYAKYVG